MKSGAVAVAAIGLMLALGACRTSCAREHASRHSPAQGALAILPAAASTVIHVDVAALRASGAGGRLLQLVPELPEGARLLDDLRTRAGLDVLHALRSVTVALSDDVNASHRFAAILRSDSFDQARLVGYARERLQADGGDLTQVPHRGRTLWVSRRRPDLAAFVLDAQTLILAGGGWAELAADLADRAGGTKSVEDRSELMHLCERVAAGRQAWLAAVVPARVRDMLHRDVRLSVASSVSRVGVGFGLPSTLELDLTADTGSEADARALVARGLDAVRGARRAPAFLLLGLAPFLDVVTARAEGPVLQAHVSLPSSQVDDLIARLRTALRLARTPRPPGFGRE